MFGSSTCFYFLFFLSGTLLASILRYNSFDYMVLSVVVSRLLSNIFIKEYNCCLLHSHILFSFFPTFFYPWKSLVLQNPLEQELISFLTKIKGEQSLKFMDLYIFLKSWISSKSPFSSDENCCFSSLLVHISSLTLSPVVKGIRF